MLYWRYRAYDADLRIHNGVVKAVDFVHMAVKLRQGGLQLISASTIDSITYRAELRLERYRGLFDNLTNTHDIEPHLPNTQTSESLIRRIKRKLLTYF